MIKIKTGYQADQFVSIPDEEAHIAYYLFAHQDARAIFTNGVALRGQDIVRIEPDLHQAFGWNPTHKLDNDDWNQVRSSDVYRTLDRRMRIAKEVAARMSPKDMRVPCSVLAKQHNLLKLQSRTYTGGKSVGELLPRTHV